MPADLFCISNKFVYYAKHDVVRRDQKWVSRDETGKKLLRLAPKP